MIAWSIFYADHRVDGDSVAAWRDAPSEGVQVVVGWAPPPIRRWGLPRRPIVDDRMLWTGQDEYDPFHTGLTKNGTKIPDVEYALIFETAAYGER